MQKTLFVKALIVFGLMLVIGLPLLMIQETIKERMEFRQEAVDSIAADSVREQTIIGPILVIPYVEQYDERVEIAADKDQKSDVPARTQVQRRSMQRRLLVYPNYLAAERHHRDRPPLPRHPPGAGLQRPACASRATSRCPALSSCRARRRTRA